MDIIITTTTTSINMGYLSSKLIFSPKIYGDLGSVEREQQHLLMLYLMKFSFQCFLCSNMITEKKLFHFIHDTCSLVVD